MTGRCIAVAAALAMLGLGSSAVSAAEPEAPSAAELTQALREFLSQRGDICLSKYDWPIEVSARDVATGTRNAVQLPVMERQGLVESENGFVVFKDGDKEEKVPARRYRLTDLGKRSYKARETRSRARDGGEVTHHGDLCAGRIVLSEWVWIRVPAVPGGGRDTAIASYRYRYQPEPWVDNEAIRRVFPMIDQVIKGQGSLEMMQRFHFDGVNWVADAVIE